MDSNKPEIARDVFPYLRVYKDGTVERINGTEVVPAGLDSDSDVLSKDVVIIPDTGVSVRIYRPNFLKGDRKLPLVVYFHGGAFCIATPAEPKYHVCLNKLTAEGHAIVVSVDYRLAPEHPLPTAYEDSWAAVQWIVSHADETGGGGEPWLKEYVDFEQVFWAGDSAGANIAHHLAFRVKESGVKILGIGMIHPYFWGKDPIGSEAGDPRKGMVDNWWTFVCPSEKGCEDPLINPFVEGAPRLEGLGCERVLVMVAGKDILRERGKLYYDRLVRSGWKGKAEYMETEGEDHVFHIFDHNSAKAKSLIKRLAAFVTKGKDEDNAIVTTTA